MHKAIYLILFILVCLRQDNKNMFYKNIKFVSNPNDYLVLVNKNNKLPSSYIPNDLEMVEQKYLRKAAKEKFEEMRKDAFEQGYIITIASAYRDYDYQKKLFAYYVKEKGLDYALSCSAKAGHSEHQTGLAVDIEGSNNDYNKFIETKEYEWLKDNAHKYGFILRYPKGKENITGFKFEPWHYRYVGEIATYIYQNKLSLEEYLSKRKK